MSRVSRRAFGLALAGIMGAEVVAKSIMRAVKLATSVEGIPAYRDYTAKLSREFTVIGKS